MKDWDVLSEKLVKFAQERDWEQFHNAKDLALALGLASGAKLAQALADRHGEALSQRRTDA